MAVDGNKVAVVVGASRGIGRASALALARAGADVVVAARTQSDIDQLAKEIEGLGRGSLAVTADVEKRRDIEDLVQQTVGRFSGVDILVYASGVGFIEKTLAESTDEHFDKTMAVNLRGGYWAMREVLTRGKMIEQKSGRIVMIASDASKRGDAGFAVYSASKHAVLGLVRCVACEVGPLGITVNAVCPGFVWTKMVEDLIPEIATVYGVKREGVTDMLKEYDPLKRISVPEEVADLVVYLSMTAGGGATTGQGLNMATTTWS